MKQELPFAVALLAGGCLLWCSQSESPFANTTQANRPAIVDAAVDARLKSPTGAGAGLRQHMDDSQTEATAINQASGQPDNVGLASYLDDSTGESTGESKKPASEPSSPHASQFQRFARNPIIAPFVHEKTDPQSAQFLANASKRLEMSKPFGSSLQLTGNLFGQSVTATGNYYQMGQGTNKSRVELRFDSAPKSAAILHVCDGRFVYKLQIDENTEALEFIDLSRIDENTNAISTTGWIATGGIASLLSHFGSAFNFGDLELIDETTIVIRGSWNSVALNRIVTEQTISGGRAAAENPWDQLPRQLPHAVELVFQREPGFDYFPRRVAFKNFVARKGNPTIETRVTLEFSSPKPSGDFPDGLFVIDSTGFDSLDATDRYIATINGFQQSQPRLNGGTIER